ncbi:MAG TPA: GatB/YqeY domain-containing protein [Candidatus Dormibacteraeota bacterium]|nr:GatB/YqeY domain-containing protein [Candidatus Dormibacteraeota bacterium]
MLEQKIEQDLKVALLSGDKNTTATLRGLKSSLLNLKIEQTKRDQGLSDQEVTAVLRKEAKKRQESADLYLKGGAQDRAQSELNEKALIERYLPAPLSEEGLIQIVTQTIAELGVNDPSAMGQVIAAVKQKTAGAADGAVIARLVKEGLNK